MKTKYPFPHDAKVFLVSDTEFEIVYYSRGYQKYKRIRERETQTWEDTIEQEISLDMFWFIVACVEKSSYHA